MPAACIAALLCVVLGPRQETRPWTPTLWLAGRSATELVALVREQPWDAEALWFGALAVDAPAPALTSLTDALAAHGARWTRAVLQWRQGQDPAQRTRAAAAWLTLRPWLVEVLAGSGFITVLDAQQVAATEGAFEVLAECEHPLLRVFADVCWCERQREEIDITEGVYRLLESTQQRLEAVRSLDSRWLRCRVQLARVLWRDTKGLLEGLEAEILEHARRAGDVDLEVQARIEQVRHGLHLGQPDLSLTHLTALRAALARRHPAPNGVPELLVALSALRLFSLLEDAAGIAAAQQDLAAACQRWSAPAGDRTAVVALAGEFDLQPPAARGAAEVEALLQDLGLRRRLPRVARPALGMAVGRGLRGLLAAGPEARTRALGILEQQRKTGLPPSAHVPLDPLLTPESGDFAAQLATSSHGRAARSGSEADRTFWVRERIRCRIAHLDTMSAAEANAVRDVLPHMFVRQEALALCAHQDSTVRLARRSARDLFELALRWAMHPRVQGPDPLLWVAEQVCRNTLFLGTEARHMAAVLVPGFEDVFDAQDRAQANDRQNRFVSQYLAGELANARFAPPSAKQCEQVFGAGAHALYWLPFRDRLLVLHRAPDGQVHAKWQEVAERQLQLAVSDLRRDVAAPGVLDASLCQRWQQLSRQLLPATLLAATQQGTVGTLVVIAPEPLATLPIEALLTETVTWRDGLAWRELPYLMRAWNVRRLPSLAFAEVLAARRSTRPATLRCLHVDLLADAPPRAPDPAFAQRTAAQADARRLAEELATGWHTLVLFAHGREQGIALAAGTWTTDAIARCKAPLELVLLGVCGSAAAPRLRGAFAEQPESPVSAFLMAGASAVVGGLFDVPEAPTRRFVARVLAQHGEPVSAALGNARREFTQQDETAHPYHWCGLVLHGLDVAVR